MPALRKDVALSGAFLLGLLLQHQMLTMPGSPGFSWSATLFCLCVFGLVGVLVVAAAEKTAAVGDKRAEDVEEGLAPSLTAAAAPKGAMVEAPSKAGIKEAASASYIDVTQYCTADPSHVRKWKLTQQALCQAIQALVDQKLTVLYFPVGTYDCASETILIDFSAIFPDSTAATAAYQHLRNGMSWRGEGQNSSVSLGDQTGRGAPAFWVRWSSPPSGRISADVFYWEFTGLNFSGSADNVLVQIGGSDPNEMPFNSCIVDVAVNNGYKAPQDGGIGPARGLELVRFLQSRLNVVGTSATGIGTIFNTCEFCTLLSGSFSNAQRTVGKSADCPTGVRVCKGVGLYLQDCASLNLLNINCEVAYDGIELTGSTIGILFGTIVSNNCDYDGSVLVLSDDLKTTSRNTVHMLLRRNTRQYTGGMFQTAVRGSKDRVATCLTISTDLTR